MSAKKKAVIYRPLVDDYFFELNLYSYRKKYNCKTHPKNNRYTGMSIICF